MMLWPRLLPGLLALLVVAEAAHAPKALCLGKDGSVVTTGICAPANNMASFAHLGNNRVTKLLARLLLARQGTTDNSTTSDNSTDTSGLNSTDTSGMNSTDTSGLNSTDTTGLNSTDTTGLNSTDTTGLNSTEITTSDNSTDTTGLNSTDTTAGNSTTGTGAAPIIVGSNNNTWTPGDLSGSNSTMDTSNSTSAGSASMLTSSTSSMAAESNSTLTTSAAAAGSNSTATGSISTSATGSTGAVSIAISSTSSGAVAGSNSTLAGSTSMSSAAAGAGSTTASIASSAAAGSNSTMAGSTATSSTTSAAAGSTAASSTTSAAAGSTSLSITSSAAVGSSSGSVVSSTSTKSIGTVSPLSQPSNIPSNLPQRIASYETPGGKALLTCPDDDGKLYNSTDGTPLLIQCNLQPTTSPGHSYYFPNFNQCVENCTITPDCDIVGFTGQNQCIEYPPASSSSKRSRYRRQDAGSVWYARPPTASELATLVAGGTVVSLPQNSTASNSTTTSSGSSGTAASGTTTSGTTTSGTTTSGTAMSGTTTTGSATPSQSCVSGSTYNDPAGASYQILCDSDVVNATYSTPTASNFTDCVNKCTTDTTCAAASWNGTVCALKGPSGESSFAPGVTLAIWTGTYTSTASSSTAASTSSNGTTQATGSTTATVTSSSGPASGSTSGSSTTSSIPTPSQAVPVCPSSDGQIYTTSSQSFTIECSVSHPGGDLSNSTVSTYQGCIDLCGSTAGCVAITYRSGTCYLKSSMAASNSDNTSQSARLTSLNPSGIILPTDTTSSGKTPGGKPYVLCPKNDGQLYNATDGVYFLIQCQMSFSGPQIDSVFVTNFNLCIERCSNSTACNSVGFSFGTCTRYGPSSNSTTSSSVTATISARDLSRRQTTDTWGARVPTASELAILLAGGTIPSLPQSSTSVSGSPSTSANGTTPSGMATTTLTLPGTTVITTVTVVNNQTIPVTYTVTPGAVPTGSSGVVATPTSSAASSQSGGATSATSTGLKTITWSTSWLCASPATFTFTQGPQSPQVTGIWDQFGGPPPGGPPPAPPGGDGPLPFTAAPAWEQYLWPGTGGR